MRESRFDYLAIIALISDLITVSVANLQQRNGDEEVSEDKLELGLYCRMRPSNKWVQRYNNTKLWTLNV